MPGGGEGLVPVEPFELRQQREMFERGLWQPKFDPHGDPSMQSMRAGQHAAWVKNEWPFLPQTRSEAVLAALVAARYPRRETITHRGRRYFSWQRGRIRPYGQGYYLDGEHKVVETKSRLAILVKEAA